MMKTMMNTKIGKVFKKIGFVFLCIIIIWTTFWTCELTYTAVQYVHRGFDAYTALKWAIDDVNYEMEELNRYIQNLFPERKEKRKIEEYPIANWNINWNIMNKP